jgi:Flp pilus assembly protein TadB
MARKHPQRNQSLERSRGSTPDAHSTPITPEVILPVPGSNKLITAQIIQILIEKNNPDEVERLMKAELDYNEKRFAILREHSEKDPDSMDERETSRFRRVQYKCLIAVLVGLLLATPFVNVTIAAAFAILCILIVCGVLLNGRERELDLPGFVKLFSAIVKREQ